MICADTAGWLCPHVTGAMLLDARYLERGEIRAAIRALELAGELPLGRPRGDRVRTRLASLRAGLN